MWQTNTTLKTVASLRMVRLAAEFRGVTLHNIYRTRRQKVIFER